MHMKEAVVTQGHEDLFPQDALSCQPEAGCSLGTTAPSPLRPQHDQHADASVQIFKNMG